MDDYISYLASLDFKEENIDQNKDQKTKNDKQDDKSDTDNESMKVQVLFNYNRME